MNSQKSKKELYTETIDTIDRLPDKKSSEAAWPEFPHKP